MVYRDRSPSRTYKEIDNNMIGRSAFIKRGKLVGQTVTIRQSLDNDKFIVTHGDDRYVCHRSMFIMSKGIAKIKGR